MQDIKETVSPRPSALATRYLKQRLSTSILKIC